MMFIMLTSTTCIVNMLLLVKTLTLSHEDFENTLYRQTMLSISVIYMIINICIILSDTVN